ncbi:alpha/beta fold hydrolase [Nonomuraea sp. NPDC050536]|uniref:alpha/beta fold hydrolase n=1 Tax=Nonomuraea sp. NPDC050536 TaxID=3364366 RepID=UPI0037C61477
MTTRVPVNGIEIVYESMGSPDGRPLLLIMGLGAQLIHWDDDLCGLLAEHGHHVVRYDNRDSGLSTHLPQAGDPPYLLEDMADDAAGLLDALGWEAAHIVGASMGGMIAQALAVRHPERVLTLTSIMSTPGPSISPPTEAALAVLMSAPPSEREALIEHELHTWSIIGSPGFPFDHERVTRMTGTAYDRAWDPDGTARQLAAIMASPDRTEALAGVRVPTLVIHGEDDQLVPLVGGQATAAAVPGARLLTFPGMGHDFPRPLWPEIVGAIAKHTAG